MNRSEVIEGEVRLENCFATDNSPMPLAPERPEVKSDQCPKIAFWSGCQLNNQVLVNPADGGPPGHLPRGGGGGAFCFLPLRFPKYLRNAWVYQNKI